MVRITRGEAEGESCQPPAPCDLLANIQFNKRVLNVQKAVKVSQGGPYAFTVSTGVQRVGAWGARQDKKKKQTRP